MHRKVEPQDVPSPEAEMMPSVPVYGDDSGFGPDIEVPASKPRTPKSSTSLSSANDGDMKTTVNESLYLPLDTKSPGVTATALSAHDRPHPVSSNTCLLASGTCLVPCIGNHVFQFSANPNTKGRPVNPSDIGVTSSPDVTPSTSSDVRVLPIKSCNCWKQSVFGTNNSPSLYDVLMRSASRVSNPRTGLDTQHLYSANEGPMAKFGCGPGPKFCFQFPSPVYSSGTGKPTVPRPPLILPTVTSTGSLAKIGQSPDVGEEPEIQLLASVTGSEVGSESSQSSGSGSGIWFGRSPRSASVSSTTFGPSSSPSMGTELVSVQSPDPVNGPGPDLGNLPALQNGSGSQFGQCPIPSNGSGIWFGQPPASETGSGTIFGQVPVSLKGPVPVFGHSPNPVNGSGSDCQLPAVSNDSSPRHSQYPTPLNGSGIWFGHPPSSASGSGTKFGQPTSSASLPWQAELSGGSATSSSAPPTSDNGQDIWPGEQLTSVGQRNPRSLRGNNSQLLTSVIGKQSACGVPDIRDIPPGTEKRMTAFCHNCGSKYPIPQARFCCMCGERRIVLR